MNTNPPLTRKQKLRHDQPLWLATPKTSVVTRQKAISASYDVLIIGAGISGALMANALVGKGLKVLIVDRREPVRGSSAASTAMIQHEIDIPLHKLSKLIGTDKAAPCFSPVRNTARVP